MNKQSAATPQNSPRGTLVLFGGINIEGSAEEGWRTKSAFARYVLDLLEHFDRVVLYAPVHHRGQLFKTALDHPRLITKPIPTGRVSMLSLWARVLLDVRDASVVLHLPNSLPLFPIYWLIRRRARSVAAYLSSDYTYWKSAVRADALNLRSHLYERAHKSALGSAHFVIARGKYLASLARSLNAEVHETLPISAVEFQGPSLSVESPHPNPAAPHVLFIGKLLWSKGVRELLDAFASVLEAEPYRDLTLDIVGDGEESAPIKEYAAKRLPRGQVRFWGWIDTPTDLQDRWSEATMLVVPSTSSEGVPRVIDESFVHGVPVIASRIGGIADEFPNGEVCLVEPASVAALSVAIRSLLADEAKRKQLRQNATARLERFSALRSAGHQHAALFQRFCAASRRPERR